MVHSNGFALAMLGLLILSACATTDENLTGEAYSRGVVSYKCDKVDTLLEGAAKTYTVKGLDYEVTNVYVSDPADSGATKVKFSVNGELSTLLLKNQYWVTTQRDGTGTLGVHALRVEPGKPGEKGDWTGEVQFCLHGQ